VTILELEVKRRNYELLNQINDSIWNQLETFCVYLYVKEPSAVFDSIVRCSRNLVDLNIVDMMCAKLANKIEGVSDIVGNNPHLKRICINCTVDIVFVESLLHATCMPNLELLTLRTDNTVTLSTVAKLVKSCAHSTTFDISNFNHSNSFTVKHPNQRRGNSEKILREITIFDRFVQTQPHDQYTSELLDLIAVANNVDSMTLSIESQVAMEVVLNNIAHCNQQISCLSVTSPQVNSAGMIAISELLAECLKLTSITINGKKFSLLTGQEEVNEFTK